MAGVNDRARFYLEQSIPDLHEFESKGLFSKGEINAIIKKRSDFEHKLNARGSQPSDWTRYIDFEIALESLEKKRCKRLGNKSPTRSSVRRISFLLDRATKKFHGSVDLWMRSLEWAKKQKAFKRVSRILADALRLYPTKPELWIYAAHYFMESQGNMTEARSYMQRGLRFCKESEKLWLEYGRLEMFYIAKIFARRRILGIERTQHEDHPQNEEDPNADEIALPAISAKDMDPSLRMNRNADQAVLEALDKTPALSGAIPMAIFDSAMGQFKDCNFGEQFFDVIAIFYDTPCCTTILQHIVDVLFVTNPISHPSWDCFIRQPLVGLTPSSAQYPAALGIALDRLNQSVKAEHQTILMAKTGSWLAGSAAQEDIDPDVRRVLAAMITRCLRRYCAAYHDDGGGPAEEFWKLVEYVKSLELENAVAEAQNWAHEVAIPPRPKV